jgi:hypothetical protein
LARILRSLSPGPLAAVRAATQNRSDRSPGKATSVNARWLEIGLRAGVLYFCCMAAAHFFGFKVPLLFVYWDVPFHAYQDKIISFAVIAYACLFHAAASQRAVVPAALFALGTTVLGLSAVNASDALRSVLDGRSTAAYWLQTALFGGYFVVLLTLYRRGPVAR